MAYGKLILEHNTAPKNVGSMPKCDPDVGTGMVGSPACGDMMQLQIRVEKGIITDAKFKAFGCGAAIAACSHTTEELMGKTLTEALNIKNKEITEHFAFPKLKAHCSVLAEEAIEAAVNDYNAKQKEIGNGTFDKYNEQCPKRNCCNAKKT